MASFNRVILMGNLTRDPEVRYTPDGTAVAEMGLAVSESYKNRSGEMTESTCFVDIVVWSRQAETCAEFLRKGSPVLVEGKLQLDRWQNKEGENRSKLRVRAVRVQFLGAPRRDAAMEDGGGDPSGGYGASAPTQAAAPGAAHNAAAEPHDDLHEDDDNLPF